MRVTQYTLTTLFLILFLQAAKPVNAQLGFSFNLNKPKEYEDQQLRSEKSEDKKFTLLRRFIQNTTTHYNYYFNANNKLNAVLDRAKQSFKDDYSQLLPFYNYTLDATAGDSIQLDSLTYKSSTAIALHDLRNDWVDNMYLLWGASYYLQKKFDSAYLMFQFINYAFSPKEKDGTLKTIGSGRDGNSAYSISTKEKNSLPRRIFTEPPSRNNAFIWQIRNSLAQDDMAEAASLIVTLKNDPNFPKRLKNDLHEVQAFWFYKQNMWDSAAVHLKQALSNATNAQEKARWEFLVAQLFEMSKNYSEAEKYYSKVSQHTTDLILDIYARLFKVRVNRDGGDNTIDKNVAQLLKMSKQGRYEEYRDIIYYMAGRMQLEGNNIDAALPLLLKSTKFSSNDPSQRNKAFLEVATIYYSRKEYRKAAAFYDSLNFSDPTLKNPDELKSRQLILNKLASQLEVIDRQDSLLRIASMPEDARKDYVKKLVKELRKSQGIKGEDPSSSPFNNAPPPSLFQSEGQKGEWYFYNKESKTRGLAAFKSRWGNRPNIDNWRRSSAIAGYIAAGNLNNQQQTGNNQQGISGSTPEISFDRMYANLPLTETQVAQAKDSISQALFASGKIYIQDLEECNQGIETLETLRSRFPMFKQMDEVLFNLYYCYQKNGESAKAAEMKKLMETNFSSSNFTTIVTTGKDPLAKGDHSEATRVYEKIYDEFIEGNFEAAIADKKNADSLYGKNFWTPQLMYIEAVYYIKQRKDSTAHSILSDLISTFDGTPLAVKATNLRSVLARRSQIEEELKNLVVTRNEDTTASKTPDVYWVNVPQPKPDTTQKLNPGKQPTPDNNKNNNNQKPDVPTGNYTFNESDAHFVILVLNKIDPVYVNESKNAFARYNRDNYYNKPMNAVLSELDADYKLLLISPFKNATEALDYVEKTKPKASSEIVPWMKAGKYSFIIATEKNLNILTASKDLELYKTFLNQHFPGKF